MTTIYHNDNSLSMPTHLPPPATILHTILHTILQSTGRHPHHLLPPPATDQPSTFLIVMASLVAIRLHFTRRHYSKAGNIASFMGKNLLFRLHHAPLL